MGHVMMVVATHCIQGSIDDKIEEHFFRAWPMALSLEQVPGKVFSDELTDNQDSGHDQSLLEQGKA